MEPHVYSQRVAELLCDGYLTKDRRADIRLTPKGLAKLHDLIDSGFLIVANRQDNVRLTDKGVAVLFACADRKVKPRREIRQIPVQKK